MVDQYWEPLGTFLSYNNLKDRKVHNLSLVAVSESLGALS